MLYLRSIAVAGLAGLALGAPATTPHVLHEKRGTLAHGWVQRGRIESSAILPMRIGLQQTNIDNGYDMLMEVSHPDSPKYGQWWSAEDVHAAFSPTNETINMVWDWLTASGIDPSRVVHSENRGWLAFDATVNEAESLLRTEYYEHEHLRSGKLRVGCDEYSIPKHLSEHIDYITPGVKLTQVVKRTVKRDAKAKRHFPKSLFIPNKIPVNRNPFQSFPWGWKPPSSQSLPPDVQDCGRNITPPCYRALYQLPQPTTATPGNSLGLFEQGSYFAKADIDAFLAKYAPYIPNGTYPIPALIDGAEYSVDVNNTSLNTGEADIDIDIATALIYPQTVTLYQTDDQLYEPEEVATTNVFNTFLDALDGSYCTYTAYGETGDDPSIDAVYPDTRPGGYTGQLQCGVFKPTPVISASYGQAENDLPINYNKRQCNEFLKLGMQGVSILIAAGDYGVASFPGDGSENGCLGAEGLVFNPQYPSNCPWVTSVGGTMLYPDQTVLDAESVMHVNLSGSAQNFSSSGGFSNYYPQPSYQLAAVSEYFAKHKPPYPSYSGFSPDIDFNTTSGLYNRIGRGYPDVAANGANLRAYTNGIDYYWYGTSLAAPLFASVLTLLNEDRASIGKGSVGFVNPVLYSNPWVLNDITNGTSVGCGTDGWAAVPGWDPVTGLGTPNYPKMKELFMSLP